MKKTGDFNEKGELFEKEVQQLLSLMGYTVNRNILLNGTQIDLLAEKANPLDNIRLIVECTDRSKLVGVPLVKQKSSVLLSTPHDGFFYKILMVSRLGFTAKAKSFAAGNPNLELFNLVELESLLINFEPYARWYFENYENSSGIFSESNLVKNYVELTCANIEGKDILPLSIKTRSWLEHKNNNLLIILGEFGSGKTSFCRHFAYTLLDERYRRKQVQPYIPILINLRDNKKAFDLRRILFDTLTNRYGIQVNSFLAIEHFCSKRHICLILDGLDEMIDRSDKQALLECWNEVFSLSTLNTKIIVTCRSNFFNSHADLIELLKNQSINTGAVANDSFDFIPNYCNHGEIVNISKLSEKEITQFIEKRFTDPMPILESIQNIHDLSDLSTRPVLLDMILSTLPEITKSKTNVNSAMLYSHYTDRWTKRDCWRVYMALDLRQSFCDSLAWSMHSSSIKEIDSNKLESIISNVIGDSVDSSEQVEKLKNDIKTCSFLVRFGPENQFRFAHKSFQEFFTARLLVRRFAKQTNDGQQLQLTLENEEYLLNKLKSLFRKLPAQHILGSVSEYSELALYELLFNYRCDAFSSHFNETLSHYSNIESEFNKMMKQARKSNILSKINLTEEIATFACELFSNLGIKLNDLLKVGLNDKDKQILYDILGLSKSLDFILSSNTLTLSEIGKIDDDSLKLTLCLAIAKGSDNIDFNFAIGLQKLLPQESWSYFLFELTKRNKQFNELIVEISNSDNLSAIDKLICYNGSIGNIKPQWNEFITEKLVIKFISSSSITDAMIGIELSLHKLPELALCIRYFLPLYQKLSDYSYKQLIVSVFSKFSPQIVFKELYFFKKHNMNKNSNQIASTIENQLIYRLILRDPSFIKALLRQDHMIVKSAISNAKFCSAQCIS